MAEIKEDTLCKYCLGCNKLSDSNFIGVRSCKIFTARHKNWRKLFENSMKEQNQKTNTNGS